MPGWFANLTAGLGPGAAGLKEGREHILHTLYLGGATLGLLVTLASIPVLLEAGSDWLILVDLAAVAWAAAGVIWRRQLGYRLRAWAGLGIIFFLGAALLVFLGPDSGGPIWVFTAAVIAGILLGLRAALGTLTLNAVLLLALAYAVGQDWLPWLAVNPVTPVRWLVLSANLLLLNALTASSVALLLRNLNQARHQEAEASRNLGRANRQLLEEQREREEAERSLRLSEARLKRAQAVAKVGSWEISFPSRTMWASKEAFEIYGLDMPADKELDLAQVQAVPLPEDRPRLDRALADLVRHDIPYEIEFRIRRPNDGQIRHIHSRAEKLLASDGTLLRVNGAFQDVTEQKEAQAARQKLEAQLLHAQKLESLGTLAGGIAHDFNNILGAVIGYSELAQFHAAEGRDNRPELDKVLEAASRARDLVQRILTFGRKMELDLSPVDLNRVVRQTCQILERTLPKMVTIHTDLAPDLAWPLTDAAQMEQVLLNLATNAGDAMPEGGELTIATGNQAAGSPLPEPGEAGGWDGPWVWLEVADTGQGMDEETRAHIFDPFFTTKEVGKGTGLGLSMVYGIVKNHGGRITCESQPGRGAAFRLWLPVGGRPGAPAPGPEEARTAAPAAGDGGVILLVDDEAALRDLGVLALTEHGYRVLTAESGEEALAVFQQKKDAVKLVILDLGMPGMGGRRCLHELKELAPALPVIVASGYLGGEQLPDSLGSQTAAILPKPFKRADLLAAVDQALRPMHGICGSIDV
ncbi:MAG: response regulator [Deltaproteobacteria bacterium]|nr:response regulator [Deltaproteobacteria bacterium]